MLVAEKYRCHRQVGWSDDAEVHAGPPDATYRVPIAVKIRHGFPGPPRPDGNRDRFLRAGNDQQAAVLAGCQSIAPIFETGQEGNNAYWVTRHYPRSLDALIQGRVALEPALLHRLTDRILKVLEELRDKHGRAHGNLKPTNIFLDGKGIASADIVLSDMTVREDAGNQGTDCYSLGAVLYQLIRGRSIRNFDWPMVNGPDWEKLGNVADGWREFCNFLMSPETSAKTDALADARKAFKNMRRLAAAGRREDHGAASNEKTERPATAPAKKGLWAGIGAAVVAGISAVALAVQPADSKAKNYLRTLPVLGMYAGRLFPLPTSTPLPTPEPTPLVAQVTPRPADTPISMATPESTAIATTLAPTPTVPPTPTPVPTPTYIGYAAVLERFKQHVDAPEMVDAPENLNGYLQDLKNDIGYGSVAAEPDVVAFKNKLPKQIPTSGSQPDLPTDRWIKETASRQEDVQSVTYHWYSNSQIRMQFNRVSNPNGPAFYLSATTVPLRLGALLAAVSDPQGKDPLKSYVAPNGPVSGQFVGGQYGPRAFWMTLDSVNISRYSDKGKPSEDSPMNGLSGSDALRLVRSAGCTLPTLVQWDAVLSSPSGQEWVRRWRTAGKVRGPQWSAFAKETKAYALANTGAKLPNDQCFGDKTTLDPVTETADTGLFFEPVTTRAIALYSHLIGNVGQYVVDNAGNPTKYYFAGGSAESAPSVFQNLNAPPLASAFIPAADAGLRLAAPAKGNGSDKNPALDKLKVDLDAELARVQKLP